MGAGVHCQTLTLGGAGELDLPPAGLDGDAWPGVGSARRVRAVRTQHFGEDSDCVVPLEGDEAWRTREPLAKGGVDVVTQVAEALRQVAQERNRGAVVAQQPRPVRELRLPGRSTDQELGEALVLADLLDDRDRRLRVADKEQESCGAAVDEEVAQGGEGEGTNVEFKNGAAERG